jgi:hypothetical protein
MVRKSGFQFQARASIFSSPLIPEGLPNQWAKGVLFPEVKWPNPKYDHITLILRMREAISPTIP